MAPQVSVIVVNWNGKQYLKDCLDSLIEQTFKDFETIIVDNGSTDGSVELIMNSYPWVHLVCFKRNTGFAGGNNAGFNRALGKYIVTLNNDTRVDKQWLAELVAAVEEKNEIGMVASRICSWDSPDQLDSLGVAICNDGMSRGSRRNRSFSGLSVEKHEKILVPSACAALYRREMLDEIGFFDEDFFAYCEDTDLGLRGRIAGWQAILARDAVVQHRYSRSGGEFSPFKLYLVERNHFWAAIKCFPPSKLLTLPLWTLMRYFVQLKVVLAGRGAGAQFRNTSGSDLIMAVLRGVADGLFGVPCILRKRRSIMASRRLSDREMEVLLNTYKISFMELLDAG